MYLTGRAIAQAVSRRLPTAAAQVLARVKSCWICGGHSGTETGFLRVLRFPLILIPPTAAYSSSSSSIIIYHPAKTSASVTLVRQLVLKVLAWSEFPQTLTL
jgi:hypothetical protein